MNKEIASKSVSPKKTAKTASAPQVVSLGKKDSSLITLADKVAESGIRSGNFRFANAEKLFPLEPKYRCVEKYYPYAKGGPLLVDEPTTKGDEKICALKKDHLEKLGIRYLIITSGMDLQAAHEQLKGK